MKRLIAALLLVPVLSACGDDPGGATADDPAPEPTTVEPTLVQPIVLTSAGGKVSTKAYFVDKKADMKAYVRTFDDRDDVIAALQQGVEDAGEREGRLAVATVAIGCDVPDGVTVTEGADGWEVTPGKVADPKQECFAPMTTIALVEVPAD